MPHPYPAPQLKPLFELSATLERFDDLGATPQGHRMMAVVGQGSGTISGDRVRGQVLHGSGGDWLLLRPDGAAQLDVRITIKTDDEALIVNVTHAPTAEEIEEELAEAEAEVGIEREETDEQIAETAAAAADEAADEDGAKPDGE